MLLLIGCVGAFVALLYVYIVRTFSYWTRRNVAQPTITTSLRENFNAICGIETFVDVWKGIYERSKQFRLYGVYQFNAPVLVIRDQELIKNIAVKDFDHFLDHRDLAGRTSDPIWAKNLFALKGEKWRVMRATMSPVFTGSKMRTMFKLIDEVAQKYVNYYKNGPAQFSLEFKDTFTRLSNDVIASTAFGLQCDSLQERQNQFYLMGKEATNFGGIIRSFQFLLALTAPKIANLFNVQFFSANVRKFFGDLVPRTIKMREECNIQRPDLIHLLMEARKGLLRYDEETQQKEAGFAELEESQFAKNDKLRLTELTDEDITAQAVIFLTGGFDTVATALGFCAYELAVNTDVQERLRREILDNLKANNGELSYDGIQKMKYMDMVVSEVLRKWPPAIILDRICSKPYTIQKATGDEPEITLNPGETIIFPVIAIHRDPEIYPKPDLFDPERFNDDNKHLITPYNYMPFGAGPRHCIAIRYALMEIKTVISRILVDFDIFPVERTQIPLKLQKAQFTLQAENGFWFGLRRRS